MYKNLLFVKSSLHKILNDLLHIQAFLFILFVFINVGLVKGEHHDKAKLASHTNYFTLCLNLTIFSIKNQSKTT